MTQELAKTTTVLPPARSDSTDALLLAVVKTGNIDLAKQIIEMRDHERKTNALIAFNNAFADAKADIPVILKNRTVKFTSSKGDVEYDHEDLGGIAEVVNPILAANGLSYRYRTTELEGGRVSVTCIVSHRDGHFEETTLSAGRDTSGAKNDIQGIGSSITYLQRYTLKSALGLAAAKDDDGIAAQAGAAPQYVSAAQLTELNALADELSVDKAIFCNLPTIKAQSLAHIPAKDFAHAIATMELKRGRKGSK